jgi:hypothetical protein
MIQIVATSRTDCAAAYSIGRIEVAKNCGLTQQLWKNCRSTPPDSRASSG